MINIIIYHVLMYNIGYLPQIWRLLKYSRPRKVYISDPPVMFLYVLVYSSAYFYPNSYALNRGCCTRLHTKAHDER